MSGPTRELIKQQYIKSKKAWLNYDDINYNTPVENETMLTHRSRTILRNWPEEKVSTWTIKIYWQSSVYRTMFPKSKLENIALPLHRVRRKARELCFPLPFCQVPQWWKGQKSLLIRSKCQGNKALGLLCK